MFLPTPLHLITTTTTTTTELPEDKQDVSFVWVTKSFALRVCKQYVEEKQRILENQRKCLWKIIKLKVDAKEKINMQKLETASNKSL